MADRQTLLYLAIGAAAFWLLFMRGSAGGGGGGGLGEPDLDTGNFGGYVGPYAITTHGKIDAGEDVLFSVRFKNNGDQTQTINVFYEVGNLPGERFAHSQEILDPGEEATHHTTDQFTTQHLQKVAGTSQVFRVVLMDGDDQILGIKQDVEASFAG